MRTVIAFLVYRVLVLFCLTLLPAMLSAQAKSPNLTQLRSEEKTLSDTLRLAPEQLPYSVIIPVEGQHRLIYRSVPDTRRKAVRKSERADRSVSPRPGYNHLGLRQEEKLRKLHRWKTKEQREC